jgi:hypothetical protein
MAREGGGGERDFRLVLRQGRDVQEVAVRVAAALDRAALRALAAAVVERLAAAGE